MGFQFPRQQVTAQASAIAGPGGSVLGRRAAFDLWRPMATDANGDDTWEIGDQRAWSRDLGRTDAITRSGFDRWREYVVGTGLRLQSRIDEEELGIDEKSVEKWQKRAEKRFNMWAESKFCSFEGDQNFYEMQQTLAESKQASGDVFAVLRAKSRPGWPFVLTIQLVEADRVCNPNNGANTATLFEGIERNEQGEIICIHVANHHPNSLLPPAKREWTAIDVFGANGRRNILHWKRQRRPGQSRGMPLPSVITGTLKQLGRYTDAEIDAAVNSATMAIFAEMDTASFDDIFSAEQRELYVSQALQARQNATALPSGQIINTLPGEKIYTPTPGRPNPNAPPFFDLFLKLCAMGLGVPEEIIVGKFTTSYTAAQAAFQQWFQSVFIERAGLVWNFCQPVYETFLEDCVIDGIIAAPGFLVNPFIRYAYSGSQWTGSGRFVLNPRQEAEAARIRASFMTTEAEESLAYDGGDWDTRHRQRAREAAARRRDSLPPLGETQVSDSQGGPDDQSPDDQSPDQPGEDPVT